jgi:hypothetical protein
MISEVCPCGGEVKESTWLIETIVGLNKNGIGGMTLPVTVWCWRCNACGRNEYEYIDSTQFKVRRPTTSTSASC